MFKPFKFVLGADSSILLDACVSSDGTLVISVLSTLESIIEFSRECARAYLHRHKKGIEDHIFYMASNKTKIPCTNPQGFVKILDFLQSKGKLKLNFHLMMSDTINRYLAGETHLIQAVPVSASKFPDANPSGAGAKGEDKWEQDTSDSRFERIEKAITLVNQTYSNPSIPDDFKMDVIKAMRPYIVPADKEAPADMDTDQNDE